MYLLDLQGVDDDVISKKVWHLTIKTQKDRNRKIDKII